MSVSRRKFLMSGAVVSAAFVLKPSTFILGQSTVRSNSTSEPVNAYSREMFEPYVGDVFRVRVEKQMVTLKLIALENLQPDSYTITRGKCTPTDCFSLRFQAATKLPDTASVRQLNHSKLGSFDLFMTQSEDGPRFQHTAIVNHLI